MVQYVFRIRNAPWTLLLLNPLPVHYSHNISCLFSDVCTKYQEAAKIVNLALQGVISQCVPGAKVLDICEFGHTVIETSAKKLFTKKVNGAEIPRGVAFPVCISVNDVVCNMSPLETDELVSSTSCASFHLIVLRMMIFVHPVILHCRFACATIACPFGGRALNGTRTKSKAGRLNIKHARVL